jgi:hypothetical protein
MGGKQKHTLQICIKKVARDTLNGIIKGEDMNALAILHISTLVY